MIDPTHTAVGTWSGGRFMHFGEPLEDERLAALLSPGDDIATVITADVYGTGDADRLLGGALAGRSRDGYCLVGAVGHDFYEGEREGPRGFPRFSDPRLRGPDAYLDYLRMAAERSLQRCGADHFDLLLLHNPDRLGYTHPAVWDAMARLREDGLTRRVGVAPGPANGFTLDFIDCLERYGDIIDWAMLILNPLEPWPGEFALGAASAHDVSVIARVVDYGGIFHDDVRPGHVFAPGDHRTYRPSGWVEQGCARLELMRPIAQRVGLTPLQLAAQWDLAHPAVRCVAPTLIQEPGPEARTVEDKRRELAETPVEILLSDDDVAALRTIGDNSGCMALKGASPDHDGAERADAWDLGDDLIAVAQRWGIDPARDLRRRHAAAPAPA